MELIESAAPALLPDVQNSTSSGLRQLSLRSKELWCLMNHLQRLIGMVRALMEGRTRLLPAPAPWRPPLEAWLMMEVANQPATLVALDTKGPNVIGRDGRCSNIVLPDDHISRRHAQMCYENGRFVIHDLGSTHGTYVNQRRVTLQCLEHADTIRLGDMALLFLTTASCAAEDDADVE